MIILTNKILQLEIQEPGQNYKGSRFDWTGQISQIVFNNKHTFCTEETEDQSKIDSHGRGLYNEFGFDAPVGYYDCPVNGKFLKIGVGRLTKKDKEAYSFNRPYDIEPVTIDIQKSLLSATFVINSNPVRGYAYKLIKVITLCENSFKIRYELTNTGKFPIMTNEYVHNFLSINKRPIDGNYILRFSFEIDPKTFGEYVDPEKIISFDKNVMKWNGIPNELFFFSLMNPPYIQRARWELESLNDNIGISEKGNFNLLRINVWGTRHVVSPEIYFPIHLRPGMLCSWEREYEIYKINK